VTPTWYDLLGVEPDASADEIRAAWKAAIADLDPGDRRFRALNGAAEVLLDPEKRSEYDASLEPDEDAPTQVAPPLTRHFWPSSASLPRARNDGSAGVPVE